MPLLILGGIPSSILRRTGRSVPAIDGWEVKLVNSRDKGRADLYSCWTDVMSIADNAEDGAHIFAYHSRNVDHQIFRNRLYDRHRLLWMNIDTLKDYGSDEYWRRILAQVDFEIQWRQYLRPKGPEAPSFLPQSSFSPIRCKDMWDRIRSVNVQQDNLELIAKLVAHFRVIHHRKKYWEDARGIQFRVAIDKHAFYAPYGNTKFTFRLPDGFHYDVKGASDRQEFRVKDFEDKLHRVGKYTNIDCHGSVRGGE